MCVFFSSVVFQTRVPSDVVHTSSSASSSSSPHQDPLIAHVNLKNRNATQALFYKYNLSSLLRRWSAIFPKKMPLVSTAQQYKRWTEKVWAMFSHNGKLRFVAVACWKWTHLPSFPAKIRDSSSLKRWIPHLFSCYLLHECISVFIAFSFRLFLFCFG